MRADYHLSQQINSGDHVQSSPEVWIGSRSDLLGECMCASKPRLSKWICFAFAHCRSHAKLAKQAQAVDPLSLSQRNFLPDPVCNQRHLQCPLCQISYVAPKHRQTCYSICWDTLMPGRVAAVYPSTQTHTFLETHLPEITAHRGLGSGQLLHCYCGELSALITKENPTHQ